MSKQKCFETLEEQIKKKKDKYPQDYKEYEDGTAKLKMNHLTYPYYKQSIENSIINKFLNGNKLSDNEMYDMAFDILIPMMEKFLYRDNNKQRQQDSSSSLTPSTDPLENVIMDSKNNSSSYKILYPFSVKYRQRSRSIIILQTSLLTLFWAIFIYSSLFNIVFI